MKSEIKIIECPRDAMQGIDQFIPTQKKADYINTLIKVGYDVIDFGSFVSPKSVPQMRDTARVLELLELQNNTSLLSIVLNKRGALEASFYDEIKIIGYPLSISEIFQKKNSNKSISSSLDLIDDIQNLCIKKNKTLLIYLSMAFGNPYGEHWSNDLLFNYLKKMKDKGITMVSLADTIGNSTEQSIYDLYKESNSSFNLDIGLHLHSKPSDVSLKIDSAWNAGCRRFDVAINGHGGCPFAQNELVGNIPTEMLLNFLFSKNINHSIDMLAFESACNQAKKTFNL
jgi:hydroxymethylglutaryl-CoA lyase